ncbi:MAG: proton-conducting transporter membrane subunit, partial [Myxococcota bacterium]
ALLRKLPVVSLTFGVSTLAIAGVPFFSGFFSKDAILAFAFQESPALWGMGFFAAGLTAFYMMRLFALTFLGNFRFLDHDGQPGDVHVPHLPMRVPLVLLAVLAAFAGWLNIPHALAEVLPGHPAADGFVHRLAPATGEASLHLSAALEWGLMAASVLWAGAMLAVGYALYRHGPSEVMARVTAHGPAKVMHDVLFGKWYVDEIYQFVIIGPLRLVSSFMAVVVDPWVIDRAGVRGPGYLVAGAGRALSRVQSGNVQSYALVLALGVVVFLLWSVR